MNLFYVFEKSNNFIGQSKQLIKYIIVYHNILSDF